MSTSATTETRSAEGRQDGSTASAGTARAGRRAAAITRLLLGAVFMWAFADKAFGLGYATSAQDAWVRGGSPTAGFLASREGTFAPLFQAMAGQAWVDWAFMLGMLAVGTALLLGVALRLAAVGAVLLMGSLWLASLPLQNNPVVDQHLVYAAATAALAGARAGDTWGLGRWWETRRVVRSHGWLQ